MLLGFLNFVVQPLASCTATQVLKCAVDISPGVTARPWKSGVLALSPRAIPARGRVLPHRRRCSAALVSEDNADRATSMGSSGTGKVKHETKRRRGRPRGSKSKVPRAKKPQDDRQNVPESVAEARSGTSSSSFVNMRDVLSLPNGLQGEGQPANFLAELLPQVAKRDARESVSGLRDVDEEVRQHVLYQVIKNKYLSNFRGSESYRHLKPFQLKADTMQACPTCNTTGMMRCDCCQGAGIMDESVTGPPGTLYKYVGGEAIVPEFSGLIGEVVCPFCGGMTVERCLQCFGSGKVPIEGSEDRPAGAARSTGIEVAYEWASREEFLKEHANRIEIGVDGTTILRKKKRVRRKKGEVSSSGKNPVKAPVSGGPPLSSSVPGPKHFDAVGPYCELPTRRRRGRPRKGETMDELFPLHDPVSSGKKNAIRGRNETATPRVLSNAQNRNQASSDLVGSPESFVGVEYEKGNHAASSDLVDSPETFARLKYEKVVAAMKNRTFSDLLNQLVAKEGADSNRDERLSTSEE